MLGEIAGLPQRPSTPILRRTDPRPATSGQLTIAKSALMSTNADNTKHAPIFEYALLVLLATLWGSSFSFIKITVETIPPLTAMALRASMAGLFLWTIMRWQGDHMPSDTGSWLRLAKLSAITTVMPFILIAWGLQWVDAGLGVILNATTPIFAFLMTWTVTRQEAVNARKLFGVLAGIFGVALIVGTSVLSGLGDQLLPQLALVLASVCYATSAIYGRTFRHMGQFVPATGALTIGGIVLTPVALLLEQPWNMSPSIESIASLIIVALVGTAGGNLIYFRLLGTIGSLATTSQSYLRVPIGVLIGMLVLGERLSPPAMLGLACVVAGVAAMTIPKGKILTWLRR